MKAIDLAKELYPALSEKDIIFMTCPDYMELCTDITCDRSGGKKYFRDITKCIKCWDIEVNEVREAWIREAKRMCRLLGCD